MLDDQDSDAEEADSGEEGHTESDHQAKEDKAKWLGFCKSKIDKIEKVWNRKLEDPREDDESVEVPSLDYQSDDAEGSKDDTLERLLRDSESIADRLSRSHVEARKPNEMSDDLQAAFDGLKPSAKDDSDLKMETPEYGQHNYWKLADAYDLDDLLKEIE